MASASRSAVPEAVLRAVPQAVDVPVVSAALRNLGVPVSAAVRYRDMVITCGMPPLDPRTGGIVTGDIGLQTRAALDCLSLTLEAAGSSLRHVIKVTVFLSDPAMAPAMNDVYRVYFPEPFPARTTITVAAWSLPFDIEIECIAAIVDGDRP